MLLSVIGWPRKLGIFLRGGMVGWATLAEAVLLGLMGAGLSLRTGVLLFGLASLPVLELPVLPLALSRTAMKIMMPRSSAIMAPAPATMMSRRLSLAGEGFAAPAAALTALAPAPDFFCSRPLERPLLATMLARSSKPVPLPAVSTAVFL